MAKKKQQQDPMELEEDKKTPNPVNQDEEEREDAGAQPRREDPAKAQETDTDFSEAEQKRIARIVLDDYTMGLVAQQNWKAQKEKDLQHLNGEKPSIIEGINKKAWQSDRNLGLCAGVCDIYQATLLATCYNPDTIHFRATEMNDIDNRDNAEKFCKWMVGQDEVNFEPEVDDFIHNKVNHGFSVFKVDWQVRYEWVDKRIPVYSKASRPRLLRFDIKTERRRFERARIKNIDDLDKIILPSYGDSIQELPFFIEMIPVMLADIPDMTKRKLIMDKFDALKKENEKGPRRLATAPQVAAHMDSLQAQKAQAEGIQHTIDPDGRNFPMDVIEWYGFLNRKGKRERYRIWIEPTTETFIAGKPLRKIRRDGKIPYAGGPFRRQPGQLRGGSLPKLIAPIVNALNNNYNQTSDFQTIQNLPFGFADFDEGFTESIYDVDPGKIYSVDGNPSEKVYFPNLQRSLAWSYQDKQFLLEMLERMTGAASYFLTSQSNQSTATRDNIVDQKGETKFGLWVRRIQADIVEAINMCFKLYQDWAPPGLGKRVLGKDGKQIVRNLSIDTLRGNMDAAMVPDMTSGSKAYERQMAVWSVESAQANCVWLNPQMNPRGNWLLWKEAFQKQGFANPEHFMPPQPKQASDEDEEAQSEFNRMKQGEQIDPDDVEGVTPAVVQHFATHLKQKETLYQELDEEYRPNFDDHFFQTYRNYQKFMQQVAIQQQQMQVANQAINMLEGLGAKRGMMGRQTGANPGAAPQQPPTPEQQGEVGDSGTPL